MIKKKDISRELTHHTFVFTLILTKSHIQLIFNSESEIFIIQCIQVTLWIAFWIKLDPNKIMSDTSLTLMQTLKPISAQDRYKPIWHNPQTVAVSQGFERCMNSLTVAPRACSHLRIRCAGNHLIPQHSESVITFLSVNKINTPLVPNILPWHVSMSKTRRFLQHTSVYSTHISCKHEITTCYDVARWLSCENEPVALQSNKETFDSITNDITNT